MLQPEEAYGEADPALIVDIPMASVRQALGDIAVEAMNLETNILLPDGRKAVVKEISETSVRVDMNHALAGKQVEFQLAVLEVSLPGELLPSQQDTDARVATVSHILVEEESLAVRIKLELDGMVRSPTCPLVCAVAWLRRSDLAALPLLASPGCGLRAAGGEAQRVPVLPRRRQAGLSAGGADGGGLRRGGVRPGKRGGPSARAGEDAVWVAPDRDRGQDHVMRRMRAEATV